MKPTHAQHSLVRVYSTAEIAFLEGEPVADFRAAPMLTAESLDAHNHGYQCECESCLCCETTVEVPAFHSEPSAAAISLATLLVLGLVAFWGGLVGVIVTMLCGGAK